MSDNLLTQDELDFILDMQRLPQPGSTDAGPGLRVDGDRRVQDLLTRLVGHEQVTLQAHINNQQISFPLHLVEDEFHTLHLQLGMPDIYEDGPMLRPWRLTLETPVALLDDRDRASRLWVRDISFKGVLLEAQGTARTPTRVNMRFAPPGELPIRLRGLKRRQIDSRLAAYDLSESAEDEIERLRDYILQAHRRVHPDVHDPLLE
ncbi:hypothetical protein [Pseudomonas alabamensis]|uniref:hypothetical protein n=1 Tax=Pseudomonas alabamensis TaxID=3064349 RepID=UPI003F64F403